MMTKRKRINKLLLILTLSLFVFLTACKSSDDDDDSSSGSTTTTVVPTSAATGVSFNDTDMNGKEIAGTVNISMASSESDLTHYVLYWGSSTTAKQNTFPIATIAKTGSDLSHDISADTLIPNVPDQATHLLVFTKNSDGEMSTGTSVALTDLGVPSYPAASIAFSDADLDAGQISGTVNITKAVSETDLTSYVLYWGSSATAKQSTTPIATLAKTGSDLSFDFTTDTAIPTTPAATHLLVYTKNADGEMLRATNSALKDVSPVMLKTITVTASQAAVNVGTKVQLMALGTYTDDSTTDLTSSVTWTSSDNDILMVESLGMTTPVHINPNTAYTKSLSISPSSASISSWTGKQNFSAMIKYSQTAMVTATSGDISGDTSIMVSDADVDHAVKSHLTWSSANPSIFNVDGSGDMTMDSTVDISQVSLVVCNWTSNLLTSNSCSRSATLAKGETAQLTPYGLMSSKVMVSYNDPSDDITADMTADAALNFQKNLTGSVTWSSSNSSSIPVSSTGGISDATTIDTTAITGVIMSPQSVTMLKNVSHQFSATVTDFTTDTATITASYTDSGTTKAGTFPATVNQNDITSLASWTSSNTDVAKIKSAHTRATFAWVTGADSSADSTTATSFTGTWASTNWDKSGDAVNPHYKINVTQAGLVKFSITSAADAMLYLTKVSDGSVVSVYDQGGGGATEVLQLDNLAVGEYFLIPATYIGTSDVQGAGPSASFTLSIDNSGNGLATGNFIGTSTVTATINGQSAQSAVTIEAKSSTKLLTIIINFLDQVPEIASDWKEQIYGSTSHGTLNHFYKEISYGKFQFAPANENSGEVNDGIVAVNVATNHPNPQGTAGTNHKVRHPTLKLALDLADKKVDFAQYDTDNNGMISIDELSVMFLWAGGEASAGDPVAVWAHKWCIHGQASQGGATGPLSYDGVYVASCFNDNGKRGGYSAFGARQGDHQATMGVIAHELGHDAFSLPDLYDTDYTSGGIGAWGLMSGGSWGRKQGEHGGHTPNHMSAWSKINSGFVNPTKTTLTTTGITLQGTLQSTYAPIRIDASSDSTTNEYFLIEYREPAGYELGVIGRLGDMVNTFNDVSNDSSLIKGAPKPNAAFQGGIMISHIDDNLTSNSNEAHRLVDIEEADGMFYIDQARADSTSDQYYYQRGLSTNLWYSGNGTGTFDKDSSADSKSYTGATTGVTLNNFGTRGGTTMTFDATISR